MCNIKIKHLIRSIYFNNMHDTIKNKNDMKYILKKYHHIQDQYGNTFLHVAVLHNNIKYIKYLLKYKARIDIKNNYGLVPKDLTTNPEIISILENIINIS